MKKRCRKCGKLKDRSEFYKQKATRDGLTTWCKACQCKESKKWRERHKKRRYKKKNAYTRKYVLTIKGKYTRGRKRKRPEDEKCEVCNKHYSEGGTKLDYHHWDDNNFMKGIWVCQKCHLSIEALERIDKEWLNTWATLKQQIDKEAE